MGYAKLDERILSSTIWESLEQTRALQTGVLLARPCRFEGAVPQLDPGTGAETGWNLPPGHYGWVEMETTPFLRNAALDREIGVTALRALGLPDSESRDSDYEGRRMVRVRGGYVVLNFMKYRDFDHTAAKRAKEYRQRQREKTVTRDDRAVTRDDCDALRDVTHSDADSDADANSNSTLPTLPILPPVEVLGGGREGGREGGSVDSFSSPSRSELHALFLANQVTGPLALQAAKTTYLSDEEVREVVAGFPALLVERKQKGVGNWPAALAGRCRKALIQDDLVWLRAHRAQQFAKASSWPMRGIPLAPSAGPIDERLQALSEAFLEATGFRVEPPWWPQVAIAGDRVHCPVEEWVAEDLVGVAAALGLSVEFPSQNVAV